MTYFVCRWDGKKIALRGPFSREVADRVCQEYLNQDYREAMEEKDNH